MVDALPECNKIQLGGCQRRWMDFVPIGMDNNFYQNKGNTLLRQRTLLLGFPPISLWMGSYGLAEECTRNSLLQLDQNQQSGAW